MTIKQDILWRVYVSFALVLLIGAAIIFQSFKIQFINGDKWRQMADSLTTSYRTIEAERGNIYAKDGSLLATSIPYYDIRMDVNSTGMSKALFYNKLDSLALCLSQFFKDRSKSSYKKMLLDARREGERYLLIASDVTFKELQKIKDFPIFRKGKYEGGFIPVQKHTRIQPFQLLADRTIGYVQNDLKVGIEGYYDNYLRGTEGKRLMQRIAGGTWVPLNDKNEIEPENGKDVVTNLDPFIQDVTENALLKMIKKQEAHHGCAVVMEVETGKIRAIANIGETPAGGYWEMYNYAVGESTEPGSIFKLPSLIAALEHGYVDVNDSVDIKKGKIKYYDRTMKDSEGSPTGNITVKRAFEVSSNVGVSKIIYDNYKSQPEAFVSALKTMGLDQKTGIDIYGEPAPLIKDPDSSSWSGTTLPWMSVGYEVKFTPLQMLTFYNAIANKGQMMQPYLVKEIQEYGNPVKKIEPTVLQSQVCSKATIDKLQVMLEGVVDRGTAENIESDFYEIAGKTGTAKIAQPKYGYGKVYQATFCGYFPADNPKYSCIVVVNNPSKGVYYGNLVAAPVFKEISDKIYAHKIHFAQKADTTKRRSGIQHLPYVKPGYSKEVRQIFEYMDIPIQPDEADMPDSLRTKWVENVPAGHDTVVNIDKRKVIEGLVPDVQGMGLQDALYLLENNGLEVKIKGEQKGKETTP